MTSPMVCLTLPLACALLWLCLASAGCGQPSPMTQPDAPRAVGAEAYYRWLIGCMEAIERDIPAITRSAEAAADVYLKDGVEIGAYGERALVSEVCGRAGGMMTIVRADTVSSPEWKGIVLLFPQEDALQEDFAAARRFKAEGKTIVAFGRRAILAAAAGDGVAFDASIENHAAPHGGLFASGDGNWLVPTDPPASIAAAWVWTGEFVAALTRRGKMPAMHQSIFVPGAADRAAKLHDLKFHPDSPMKIAPGAVAREFLRETRRSLAALHAEDMPAIVKVAELAVRTRQAGRQVWTFAHGHAITRHVGCPHDPGYFKQINRGLFGLKRDAVIERGDFVFCVGYDRIFQGWYFKDATERMRKAGAVLAWSMTDYNTDPNTGPAAIGSDEILIGQHWAFGDAVATVPGYDAKIIPSSGVISEAVLWMTEAEMMRLLADKTRPEPPRSGPASP